MNTTKVDFHAWRFREKGLGPLENALRGVFSDAPCPPVLTARRGGWKGYSSSANISIGDMEVGLVAWGGDFQKGWGYASMTGRGCDWVGDWDLAQEALDALPEYEAKRTDIALDTFDPGLGFEATLNAYRAGGFAPAGSGGRPPKCEPMKPERPEDSAIIRIGNRERDKFYRGYEKGKDQFGADCLDSEAGLGLRLPFQVNGETVMVPMVDWFRHELELKPKTAPLPEDLIDRRDEYFAGAYPYLSHVLKDVEPQILVMRRERGPQLDLAAAAECLRKQWGNTIFTMLHAYGGDIGVVMSKIIGTTHNDRLVKAGVLLVEHE
jgi:phage replication initiation protein